MKIKPIIASSCLGLLVLAAGEEVSVLSESLDHWELRGRAMWTAEQGIISGGQDGDATKSGLLISKQSFRDFVLEFDYLIDEHGKYNSGVYLRYQPGTKGPHLQLNLGRGSAGEPVGLYFDDWLDKGDEKDEFRRPQSWNHVKTEVVGGRIRIWLNGHLVTDFEDRAKLETMPEGRLALQTYGAEGHAGWVKFRNLRVIGLPKRIEP